ncbi:MAG: Gfo/Idh/MocA family oxidoreductase [Clostridia bacterium]|nr:Gfo/Idh/MocA family oxidoreductase [Clostridia bacterium]
MVKVITYGTFDLFHEGHYNILKRAREQGDYLIVGVTSENYDKTRGKLNVKQSLIERIENVKKSGFADEIIVEEYLGQKIEDIKKYNVDKFVIGSDWLGKFDYLNEYCKVIYLERTKGVSSTQLRNAEKGIIKLGFIGSGRIAERMCRESKYVSGINFDYVYGRNEEKIKDFAEKNDLKYYSTNLDEFFEKVDAVYIATPHLTHYEFAKKALEKKKHVLCEKPITLEKEKTEELYKIAKESGVVLYEAIKTAYSPAFIRMIALAKSGVIGDIKDVDATFTKLMTDYSLREFDKMQGGGSVTELATYPLIAIVKLLGIKYKDIDFYSYYGDKDVDLYTKIILKYDNAIATAQVGLGVKKEGELIISGTKGYIIVPAPWWKTEYFEIRFENTNQTEKYFYKFDGDGLRYELAEFLRSILNNTENIYIKNEESIVISEVINKFLNKRYDEIC